MAHDYPRLVRARWTAGLLALLSSVLWLNHASLSAIQMPAPLPVHTVLETITIVIFTSVFIVCWNAYGGERKKSSVILAVAFLCTAILGFMHAISFQGMPGFPDAEDMHKSLLFWLLSRSFIATTLLGLALAPEDSEVSPAQAYFVLIAGLIATAGWMLMVFVLPHLLPLTYIQGEGQTSFKMACEVGLIAINLFTAYQLNKREEAISEPGGQEGRLQIERTPLFLAATLLAISEVYFAIYADGNDVFVAIGHVFQLLAAIAIYRGMVAVNIHTPYASLAETSQNLANSAQELSVERERLSRMIDTAIDGIITIDESQSIILVNPAAAATFGYEVQDLLGASLNTVLPERHRKVHGRHVQQFGETGETRR
ncbi:MAG: MASE3 domain-containing protein, partial [Pseudomonadota bacterium]